MNNKVFMFAVLVLMMATAGVWAQNLPANLWTSPQSTTTEGRYRSNADDFIRPDSYTGVKFDKWFGLVSFLWDGNYDAVATSGFATTVSNVYVGAFYSGNFWSSMPANNYSERSFSAGLAPAGGASGKTYNVYNNTPSVAPSSVNNTAVLVGIANMGFRLTYRTNHQSFNERNIVIGNRLYNNYQAENGYMAPQIAWAMAKDLTGNGIRPYVTFDLVFNRDYQKVTTVGVDAAGVSGDNTVRSLNHIDPALGIGMGGFTFYNKDGFKGSFDVDYVLNLNIYSNDYSYVQGGVYKTSTIKGTFSPGTFPFVEQSYISNSLTPSLSGSWSKDNLSLKFKLNLPLTLTNRDQNIMQLNASNKLVYNDTHDSISTFIFRPDIRLALQYKAIPNRLTISTGARIQATALTLETVDREYYNMGNKVASQSQKIHQNSYINIGSGTQFVSRFHIGPTFNFTENAWIEATTGVSNAYGNEETIDIFAPGGLFSFGSILVVLKF
ncbi:MAG: hypothetical protein LBH20_00050 [Treponema sp.]|jgi:hypothetical protein|nr:hypothetical protein [Treponema sp.]